MTPDRWRQVKAIFHEAVDRHPELRAAFLNECCKGDDELEREVRSLLDAADEPGSILENPVLSEGSLSGAGAPAVNPMIGRAIGNYVITNELAQGGMGVVYLARHVTLPRTVVVKSIRPLALSDEERNGLRSRFLREAHIQSQLDHPHIVRVYEFFVGDNDCFLVMEYVAGSSLRSILDQQRILPAARASDLAMQALEGLSHAHNLHYVDESGRAGAGVIHRDIKPANLVVDHRGNLKLTDFGIARVLEKSEVTKIGFSPGTAEYMSPEQIRSLPLDARSDLYSLGVTLYEMLAGRVPFPRTDADSEFDILRAHVEREPAPIRTLNPAISDALAEVVARSLDKDPARRWQTAEEFREALVLSQNDRAGGPAVAPPPARAIAKTPPRRRKWIVTAVGVAALLTLAATLTSVFWMRQASIAVLPFADISAEQNQEYFSDGLAEELRNGLAHTRGLRVAGRTSSLQFKGKAADFTVIGDKLHVDSILEGSVRMQGHRAKITVELIKAADGLHLWSATYDRDLTDIFEVQEEIARSVTAALKVTLLGDKTTQPAKPANGAAYTAYLQGRYFLKLQNAENLEKAAGYFDRAIQLDAGYAPAWVGLSECRSNQAMQVYIPAADGYRRARKAVEHALQLDPNSAMAYSVLGWIQQYHDWDWAGADASYKRALALDPWNAHVMTRAGSLAWILGRADVATRLARRAMEIDPLSPGGHQNGGVSLYKAGLFDEAVAALNNALQLAPAMENAHIALAKIYLAQSRATEALAEAEKEKDSAFRVFGMALAYHALGRRKNSDASLAELIGKYATEAGYQVAEVYAFRGEADRAFSWLERAYDEHDSGVADMKTDPLLKNLRQDPRFAAFLVKLRLPV